MRCLIQARADEKLRIAKPNDALSIRQMGTFDKFWECLARIGGTVTHLAVLHFEGPDVVLAGAALGHEGELGGLGAVGGRVDEVHDVFCDVIDVKVAVADVVLGEALGLEEDGALAAVQRETVGD
jgi:hypothetical protein